jgi:hypothetical protein
MMKMMTWNSVTSTCVEVECDKYVSNGWTQYNILGVNQYIHQITVTGECGLQGFFKYRQQVPD